MEVFYHFVYTECVSVFLFSLLLYLGSVDKIKIALILSEQKSMLSTVSSSKITWVLIFRLHCLWYLLCWCKSSCLASSCRTISNHSRFSLLSSRVSCVQLYNKGPKKHSIVVNCSFQLCFQTRWLEFCKKCHENMRSGDQFTSSEDPIFFKDGEENWIFLTGKKKRQP